MKRRVTLLTAIAITLLAVACADTDRSLPVPPAPPPAPTPAPEPVLFPRDEGPHDNRLEWWYYSGDLRDEEGGEYGFHFVVFQSRDSGDSSESGDREPPVYAAQFGLTDVGSNEHVQAARFTTGEQPQDGPGLTGLKIADWSLAANPERHVFDAGADDVRLSLSMTPTKPPALHNETGWLAAPTTGWTYYYSRPRMAAEGTLVLDGRRLTVSGDVWMDHQWGEFFVLGNPAGWQWFGVQLDDGTDLMVTQTRNVDGDIDSLYGSLINPDGSLKPLGQAGPESGDLELLTTGSWISPHTGADYPSGWTIRLPAEGIQLDLSPVVADQEIISARPESAIYWEGKVSVTGTRNGNPVRGSGYVELTGYVVPPSLPWRDAGAAR